MGNPIDEMNTGRTSTTPPCPACGTALLRIRRLAEDRQLHGGRGLQRFRCVALDCGWTGLLPPLARRWLAPPWLKRTLRPALLAIGLLNIGLVWHLNRPVIAQAVQVGPHIVLPGTHLEGDRLPGNHALRERLPATLQEDEPASYSQAPEALLRARRHCAWGLPGRDPYRGSVEQALQTAQLSTHVVQQIAHDVRTGRKVDRVTITNGSIRAVASGREFDPRRVAMTYGMSLCVDTRVNFKPGHVERGDLYEAMDEDGRMYAVMVPDVCGNVSVLGQRDELDFDAPGAGQRPQVRRAGWPQTPLADVLKLPPEQRPRELPAALIYGDPRGQEDRDSPSGQAIPLPGSLSLVAAGLALMLWVRRRR